MVGRSRCTIIGVAPAAFVGESAGAAASGWVPFVSFSDRGDLNNRRGVFASYLARLRPGVSRDRAQAAMTLLFQQQLTAEDGVRGPVGDYTIAPSPAGTGIDTGLRRQFEKPLRIIMFIVALVLVIACANVANLLLERASSRRGEISVRLAIGCSRGRLLRQLITEAVLLSTLGSLLGVAVAYAGIQGLLHIVDSGAVPIRLDVTPNLPVLPFAAQGPRLHAFGSTLERRFRVSGEPARYAGRSNTRHPIDGLVDWHAAISRQDAPFGQPIQIVGIVRDAKYNNLREEARPMIYLSIEQFPQNLRSLEVRADAPTSAIVGPVRRALSEVSKGLMCRRAVSLSEQVDHTLAAERLVMQLCSLFGGLALVLASVGLYGVLSYGVAQRTGEIGIRMALGATGRGISWLVLRETLAVTLAGVSVGLVLAVASTRVVASLLFGLTATNPQTIAFAVLVLAASVAVAAFLPARRAAHVDPMVALRHE